MNSKKKIAVTRSSMPDFQEYVDEIASLWESHWLTNMGVKHRELEVELKKYLKVSFAALYTNGHSALECILEAMELRGEVITTPFTFASTIHAIVRKGLKPVFADIKSDDYTLNPSCIEALITPKTCAILPVHVYGNLCDVDAIRAIADEHGLKVIYDAAHAFGVEKNGIGAASFGDAAMLSFHATKVFNTIEGGAICFHNAELEKSLNQWKNFGITGPETVEYVGGNAKMNEFCAAMGICNLRHIDDEIGKRKLVAERYQRNLSGIPGIKLCVPQSKMKSNYAYFPILVDEEFAGITRNTVFDALEQENISARKYFYPLASEYECYANYFDTRKTPVAKYVADRILTLPMYGDLSFEDVDRICSVIRDKLDY